MCVNSDVFVTNISGVTGINMKEINYACHVYYFDTGEITDVHIYITQGCMCTKFDMKLWIAGHNKDTWTGT